jgi:4-hydroxy 2-oxovalerate aldolase
MIKLAIFDFDGTFTNGKIIIDNNNNIIKNYNVKDGYGIKILHNNNIKVCVISGYKENNSLRNICNHLNIDYIFENINNKVEKINELLNSLNLKFNEVSYMGDDINDVELLQKVKYSGCPKNAIENCLNIADFISTKDGGDGCVREFCDYLIENKSISGLICVKYFSKRFPKKNFLNFGNTTLLNNKIDMLLSLTFLDEVVINTESDIIIDLVKKNYGNNLKIKIIKRDEKYSLENTESNDFCKDVALSCSYDNILYSPITCPLISKKTYNSMYYNFINKEYTSVILVSDGIKGQGHSNEIHNYCFGSSLISKDDMIKYGDTITDKYYIQECDRIEKIDIDYYDDYKRALYYYYNKNEPYNEDILQHLNHPLYNNINNNNNNNNVKILDCTVRDGGFANNWNYKYDDVLNMIQIAGDIGIEYYELGYLMDNKYLDANNNNNLWRNCSFDTINKIRKDVNVKCKISVMIDHWRYDFNKLPHKKETGIDLIRICNYIESIESTFNTCKELKEKGYEVSINIIACSYLTNLDLIKLKSYMISETYIDWYYFADSYGSMTPHMTENIILFYKNDPRTQHINIGYHCHNNCQIAIANTIKAIECGANMIDGTYSGEGRGGGNLPLENIILYLKIKSNYNFNITKMLDFIVNFYKTRNINSYSIRETIAGLMNIHPYRLKKYDNISDLVELYNILEELHISKKKDYKV